VRRRSDAGVGLAPPLKTIAKLRNMSVWMFVSGSSPAATGQSSQRGRGTGQVMGSWLVGVSHHTSVSKSESRYVSGEDLAPPCVDASNPSSPLLLTCNRVEVYSGADDRTQDAVRTLQRAPTGAVSIRLRDNQPYLRRMTGRESLVHLLRVVGRVDLPVVREDQIWSAGTQCASEC
jgi:hypothetical protein